MKSKHAEADSSLAVGHFSNKTLGIFTGSSQKMKDLWPHLFLWSGIVSFFFGFLAVVNTLKIGFFLNYPRTIRVNMFSPTADLYIWFGSVFIFIVVSLILRHSGLGVRPTYFGIALSIMFLGFFLLFAQKISHLSLTLDGQAIGTLLIFLGASIHLVFHIARWSQAFSTSRKTAITIVIIYFCSLAFPIELSASTFWIICAFNPANTFGKEKALLELQLSYLAYPLLSVSYLAFLFSWIWVPILLLIVNKLRKTRFWEGFARLLLPAGRPSVDENGLPSRGTTVIWHKIGSRIMLLSSLLIGIFMAYYPYLHSPRWLVGTDTYWRYLDPLQKIVESESSWVVALQERHPAYLLILLGLKTITSASSFLVVKFMPMVSVLLLASATFWLVKVGLKNGYLASLASIFSVLSITTTEGIYTGILANWFTLILWILFFVFFLKALEKKVFQEKFTNAQLGYFSILTVLSLGIFFVHPWTWGVFLVVFICYVGLTVLRERSVGWKTGLVAMLILLLNVGSAILSVLLLPKIQGWRLVETFSMYEWPFQHYGSLLSFWDVLSFLVRVWSVFLSPLFFFLAVVGIVFVMSRRGAIENLIISWTAIASIGSILVAPMGYWPPIPKFTELFRMLFVTPLQMPAAIGFYSIMNVVRHLLSHGSDEKSMRRGTTSSYWLPLMFLMFHYAIISGLLLTDFLVLELISLLVLNFAVVTVLLSRFRGHLRVCVTSLVMLLVVFSLVNCCFRGLFSLLTDPHFYRP